MKTGIMVLISATFIACGTDEKKQPTPIPSENKVEQEVAVENSPLLPQSKSEPTTREFGKGIDLPEKKSQPIEPSSQLDEIPTPATTEEADEKAEQSSVPTAQPVETESDLQPETPTDIAPVERGDSLEEAVSQPPLEPVSNLKCPAMYDNRVTWSSSAKEFFAAVGQSQNPPKSCKDSSNPYTTNKEALLPAATGAYMVKVCAYDSSDPDRISTEKTLICTIMLPF